MLSGGSAFGLDAASGVQAWLREQGRGFAVRAARVPIVPARHPVRPAQRRRQGLGPLSALSRARLCGGRRGRAPISRSAASAPAPAPPRSISRAASARPRRRRRDGLIVGALAAVNAAGSVAGRRGPWFWAAPFEAGRRIRRPRLARPLYRRARSRSAPRAAPSESTTLVVVATDAVLTKAQAKRLAVMAQIGPVARDLSGAHAARRRRGVRRRDRPPAAGRSDSRPDRASARVAANVVARAIARGVYEATALPFPGAHAELAGQIRPLTASGSAQSVDAETTIRIFDADDRVVLR